MKQKLIICALALFAIAATVVLWQGLAQGRARSSKAAGLSFAPHDRSHSEDLVRESNPPTEVGPMNSRLGSGISSESERSASREKAIAVQEKLVEEKRAALSRSIRSTSVVHGDSEPPKDKDVDGVVEQNDVKRGDKIGGYVDLVKELEVELKNLKRMKSKVK